ncbi:hypothetical protein FHU23_004126 [Clostridium saccharobutylicum]|nr:hypothetical protein [Clostridium saccharobutylicum]MBA8898757.1 hypothetical protein [Clostridium saccharobutylicum]MBA8983912.1 hypothetical protein [Clostridium saccharobutylicum]MBA8997517.1 hypothetical protein [Clostridium saccharobutylicum]MBA9008955.1 hypothetical protein [Clostridium saccharobutylicum]
MAKMEMSYGKMIKRERGAATFLYEESMEFLNCEGK